jgi:hypothetical protein
MRHYLTRPHAEHVELTDAEVEGIFFDWDGNPRERVHLGGMNEEQRTAFAQWATSSGVTLASDDATTPLQDDFAYLQGGIHQAGVPLVNRHGG